MILGTWPDNLCRCGCTYCGCSTMTYSNYYVPSANTNTTLELLKDSPRRPFGTPDFIRDRNERYRLRDVMRTRKPSSRR